MLLSLQNIQSNLLEIKERIADVAPKAGRQSDEIKIVAVTKTVPEAVIRQSYSAGLRVFGENRVQEAIPKINALNDLVNIEWHLIGHLQSNKVRKAIENFNMIQSVDSLEQAYKIAAISRELKRRIEILLEVNISGETAKSGVSPGDIIATVEQIAAMPEIVPRGLMAIGPLTTNQGLTRRAFATLREYFEKISVGQMLSGNFNILSMGMTDDFEIAIEEGSNMVRIGRGIFGERQP